MSKFPKRCTVCGITQREVMEICFLPICPSFKLRQSEYQRRQQKTINLPELPPWQPERNDP